MFSRMSSKTIADDPLTAGARAISLRDSRYGDTSGVFMDWLTPLLPREKKARMRSKIRLRAGRHGVARTPGLPRDLRVRALDSISVSRDLTHRTRLYRALALLALRWQAPRRNRHGVQGCSRNERSAGRGVTIALRLAYRISGGSPNLLYEPSLSINRWSAVVFLAIIGTAQFPYHLDDQKPLRRKKRTDWRSPRNPDIIDLVHFRQTII